MIRWKMHNYFKIGLITSNNIDIQYIDEIKPYLDFISIDFNCLNQSTINILKKNDLLVFTFTCKNINEYNIIKQFEVNGICTDILLSK